MFDKFTEKARRVVFFARYEAAQHGAQDIGTPHLLLGVIREDPNMLRSAMGGKDRMPEFMTAVEALCGKAAETVPNNVDMPLSHPARRVLAYAFEEASRADHEHIDTVHLVAGVLRENGPEAPMMHAFGMNIESVREWMKTKSPASNADRKALRQVIDSIPDDRLKVAARLLEVVKSGWFAVAAVTPDGPVTMVFPEGDTPAKGA